MGCVRFLKYMFHYMDHLNKKTRTSKFLVLLQVFNVYDYLQSNQTKPNDSEGNPTTMN